MATEDLNPAWRKTGYPTEWNLTEIPLFERPKIKAILAESYELLRKDCVEQGDNLDYPIVIDIRGGLRWKEDPLVRQLKDSKVIDLNCLVLHRDKNSQTRKDLYKRLGVSLGMYAEVFGTTAEVQGWSS